MTTEAHKPSTTNTNADVGTHGATADNAMQHDDQQIHDNDDEEEDEDDELQEDQVEVEGYGALAWPTQEAEQRQQLEHRHENIICACCGGCVITACATATAQGEDGGATTNTSTLTWITWFCSLPGHEYFCEVAEVRQHPHQNSALWYICPTKHSTSRTQDFIEDDFNLTGLSGLVPFYKEAMEMVLDVEAGKPQPPTQAHHEAHRVPDVSIVESSAELLYGLIHQRYILTRQGLQQMYAKFDASHFGTCPRVYCSLSKLVPCGRSDLPGVDTVKLYCPSCVDMYTPPSSRYQGVDGAFFGTTFPHLLFQTYPSPLTFPPPAPAHSTTNSDPATRREPTTPMTSLAKVYVPRIYGFKVSERARSGPRMQWLRMRPKTEGELDWSDQDESAEVGAQDEDEDEARRTGGGGGRGKLFGDDDDEEEGGNNSEDVSDQDAAGAATGAGGTGAGGQTGGDPMQMSGVLISEKQASLSESVRVHVARAKEEMVKLVSRGGEAGDAAAATSTSTSGPGKVMAVRTMQVGVGA
ncbi:BQ2448_6369 [Microbotryum intermedium]|uniref:Casein kinase II subunit beta n=1 Tax=Microbotryum intermedium TaxID=269621 RepID=A0A238FMC5_9BASI|nr:BQ2448_6369 [Microbotryum intermedium]